jgi:hypothetical protein
VAETFAFHVAIIVPPPGILAGVAVRVGSPTVVTETGGAETVGAGTGVGVIVPVVVAVAA